MYFLLIGPAAGSLGFVLTDQLIAAAGFPSTLQSYPESFMSLWVTVPFLWLYSLIFAYPVGVLPALTCGLIYEKFLNMKPRITLVPQPLLGAMVGSGISVILGSTFVYGSDTSNVFLHILPWWGGGLLGGLVPALVIGK